jgi:hypothetical protein
MRLALIFLATAICAALGAGAKAGQLPDFQPEEWCDLVAEAGGNRSETIDNGCVEQEQGAYDELKSTVGEVPDSVLDWCTQVAEAGGSGSYTILKGCIAQEVEAKSHRKSFKR